MKKIAVFVLILTMLTAMVFPTASSAAGAVLLKKADFVNDTFETIAKESETSCNFADKFDLSRSTSDTLIPVKKAGVSDANWNARLFYFTRTGYKVSETAAYTVCFEVATVHPGWFGVPFLVDSASDVTMLGGALSDNGETEDPNTGTNFTQAVIAKNYPATQYKVGDGYNEHGWLFYHPQITKETIQADDCQGDPVTEALFTTLKIEINGKAVTPYYLNASGQFVKMEETFAYEAEVGSDIVLGAYSREAHRHGIVRNAVLVEGTGLTLNDIKNAAPASQGGTTPATPSASTGDAFVFAAAAAVLAAAGLTSSLIVRRKKED